MKRQSLSKLVKMRGDRLREVREQHGLTQQELADRVGVNISQVVKWEKNRATPGGEALEKISRELEVTSDYILGLVNDPNSHFKEAQLKPIHRQLIDAYENGDFQRLMYLLATSEELAIKIREQPEIPRK